MRPLICADDWTSLEMGGRMKDTREPNGEGGDEMDAVLNRLREYGCEVDSDHNEWKISADEEWDSECSSSPTLIIPSSSFVVLAAPAASIPFTRNGTRILYTPERVAE